ncbi:MAG: helix-turn-helix transcriptional regulator [Chloroflexi bacterium]|nr:helix-turn-helix transcriptional regulator [Chloroflexota bacterium]
MRVVPALDSETDAPGSCHCEGGQPKNFARPCLLLLLSEAPAHGYELIDRMRPFGFEVGDPASIYKTLRQMERDGVVSSEWELPKRGPARRVYALTVDGRDLLDAWAHTLERNRAVLDNFLARFADHASNDDARPQPSHEQLVTNMRGVG